MKYITMNSEKYKGKPVPPSLPVDCSFCDEVRTWRPSLPAATLGRGSVVQTLRNFQARLTQAEASPKKLGEGM